jgi:hypothetical protein
MARARIGLRPRDAGPCVQQLLEDGSAKPANLTDQAATVLIADRLESLDRTIALGEESQLPCLFLHWSKDAHTAGDETTWLVPEAGETRS